MRVLAFDTVNVNQCFTDMFWKLKAIGQREQSRNGAVLVMPGPVATTFLYPQERILFNAKRDCNHVFHLVEALWMFAGRNDVEVLLPFNSRYGDYAEEDGTVWGAYGRRWRRSFGLDQIKTIIDLLKRDPASRQAVMGMWNPALDLDIHVKDRPCNTHIYFDCRDDKLNMTVCNRSNDILWGAYGANVVHMSMLQEIIARGVELPMGVYTQFSNNFHLYTDLPMVQDFLHTPPDADDRYSTGKVDDTPMFHEGESVNEFLEDCEEFFNKPTGDAVFKTQFMYLADNLAGAYMARKEKSQHWENLLMGINDRCDWKVAFLEWAARRDHASK